MLLLFIDGASFIQTDDHWFYYLLYQKEGTLENVFLFGSSIHFKGSLFPSRLC
jgi:hypothetical protein